MPRSHLLVLVLALPACGRIGFDLGSARTTDGGSSIDAASDAAPCVGSQIALGVDPGGAPPGGWVKLITGAVTSSGFAMTYVAPDALPYGLTFSTATGTAQIMTSDLQLDPGMQNTASVIAHGTQLLVALTASGTKLLPFDDHLVSQGAGSTRALQFAVATPLAFDLAGDFLMFVEREGAKIFARQVDLAGVDVQVGVQAVPASEAATDVTVIAGGAGFLITWLNTAATPFTVRAEIIDTSFAIVAGPTTIATSGPVMGQPVRTAWAAAQHEFLFVWSPAPATGIAHVVSQRTDPTLTPVGARIDLPAGTNPKVASDGNSFWVAWHDQTVTSQIAGARIDAAGATTLLAISGSGGADVDHDLMVLDGQVDLLWMEQGASGGPLWSVPACAL